MKSTDAVEHRVIYRFIGGRPEDGILSCGFMRKPDASKSQIDFVIPYYSCFVLLAGSGRYRDSSGFEAALGAGSVVQRLPGRVHSTEVCGDGRWLEFYVSFGKSAYDMLTSVEKLHADPPVRTFAAPENRLQRFEKLLTHMSSVPDAALLPCLFDAQQLAQELTAEDNGAAVSPLIEQACRILDEDIGRELPLENVARRLCISYESFRKLFQAEMKLSPDAYRQKKRMNAAQRLLLGGESVKAAAKALGYSDAYAFSKQFKRFFGISPVAYSGRNFRLD